MSNRVPIGQRISIVGTSGSGKTTLAQKIAKTCELPHVELDRLQWEPNWTAAPANVFQERVSQALQSDRWVVDGNYSKVRDLVSSWYRNLAQLSVPYRFWAIAPASYQARDHSRRMLQRQLRKFQKDLFWSRFHSLVDDHHLLKKSTEVSAAVSTTRISASQHFAVSVSPPHRAVVISTSDRALSLGLARVKLWLSAHWDRGKILGAQIARSRLTVKTLWFSNSHRDLAASYEYP